MSEAAKAAAQPIAAAATLDLAPWPQVDFAAFGEVQVEPLSRIQKLVGSFLSRNWVMIPHVTHQDEADIGAMEIARKALSASSGVRITPLAYLVKAAVAALQAHPQFNASIDGSGKNLVFKKYFHIGIAVDTPGGLLVPVIRDADKKSLVEIAQEIAEVSQTARTRGLSLDRMSGGCFSISSLGSIGGTGFTPIINAPEVAIMGITRAFLKPVNVDGQLQWQNTLPLSLSYDHRVINGADAARFCLSFALALARE
ncbi:MAG: Dihydrolipoyllysine-residue acetyltransferase [Hydrocarboniphaga sp.]|uniref:2-oxo acid dehydrogenase subunit E2 n=1 Tax=Hydrocarboniphaga sp. TaxID=2033016 RepID=UPI00261861F9|nr:2-oxo acid dehydrogenase subunit E2 [Hydrocarboniphaga sp.]MDB5971476.1 Dihydrolipoyllysine-residue acetyltransferase [Hydrocarboniphaga sp.]